MNKPIDASQLATPSADVILKLSAAAIYATDASGTLTFFNEPAVELWGNRPVLGETKWCGSWRLFWPGGQPMALDTCPMAICLDQNKPAENIEIIVQRPDGSERRVLVNPRPMRDASGILIGAVNTLVDVTEARLAELARRKSDDFAQNVMSNSKDCIKVLDLEGRLQTINACGCTSLEIDDPSKAIGLSYFEFWSGSDRDAARAAAQTALKSGTGRFSAEFRSVSGRVTVWDEIITVLHDSNGKPSGFLVVSRDITEQRNAERSIRRRLNQQKILTEIGNLALENDLQFTLQKTTELLSQALECPLTKILQFADSADRLVLTAGVGWRDGLIGKGTVGTDLDSQAGYTLSVDAPVVVHDLVTETRFNGPALLRDHGVRSGMSAKIPGPGGRAFGVLGVHTTKIQNFEPADVQFLVAVANIIAARWRQEEATAHSSILLKEMTHRTGNLLQLAKSVFLQTLRYTPDIEVAKKVYGQRLIAMARTNMLVFRDGGRKTNLRQLINEVLEPFEGRIKLSGRDIVLPAELSFDLGLVLHEHSTNSAKYGAFSVETGEVEIDWDLEDKNDRPCLILTWTDRTAAETGKKLGTGFGSKLLSQIVEKKYDGNLNIIEQPNYTCVMKFKVHADC